MQVLSILIGKSALHRRLLNAYPRIQAIKIKIKEKHEAIQRQVKEQKDEIKENVKKQKEEIQKKIEVFSENQKEDKNLKENKKLKKDKELKEDKNSKETRGMTTKSTKREKFHSNLSTLTNNNP